MSTTIYICCHKDYENIGITNNSYKLISDKNIKNNSNLELIKSDGQLDNRMWSELSYIYYVWKNLELDDNIGFCHYRRYFSFLNDVPQILEKPIAPALLPNYYNNFASYMIFHNANDLLGCMEIAQKDFKEYVPSIQAMFDNHVYFSCNMFVMPKELFNEYCRFIFGILLEYDKQIGINGSYINMVKHIALNKEFYLKTMTPNNQLEFQARLYGFLAERLTTAFFFKYINEHGNDSVQQLKVNLTELKYDNIH